MSGIAQGEVLSAVVSRVVGRLGSTSGFDNDARRYSVWELQNTG